MSTSTHGQKIPKIQCNLTLSQGTALRLKRLAKYYNVPQNHMIETLVNRDHGRLVKIGNLAKISEPTPTRP